MVAGSQTTGWWHGGALARVGRLVVVACLLGAWASTASFIAPSAAVAQDQEGEITADEPAAQPAGKSYLTFLVEALGIKYVIIFLLLSFGLVALLVMCFLQFRKSVLMPDALVQQFEQHLEKKELMTLEHKISFVSLVGALAPMFGLLGTVDGMVAAFMKIAQSTTTPKPNELATGISQALVTTLIGLWLAIPAIACYAVFRNWLQRFNTDVDDEAMRLMSRFQGMGKK